MRLKLRVERNRLPPVSLLWPVEDERHSVAQLLERVDERIPLESLSFGLEDYAVEVGGFEAVHYAEIATIFKDDDEVTIRPLRSSEYKVRNRTGRHQISENGRHLIDGVPWGRPPIRITRPRLDIPPLKSVDGEATALVQPRQIEAGEDAANQDLSSSAVQISRATVTFEEREENSDDNDEEDEDDGSWKDDGSVDGVSGSEDIDEEENNVTSGSDVDDGESTTSSDTSSSDETSSSSDSSSESGSAMSQPVVLPNKLLEMPQTADLSKRQFEDVTANATPPGMGKAETHRRNIRRRDTNRLRKAQELGAVGKNVTLTEWKAMGEPMSSKSAQEIVPNGTAREAHLPNGNTNAANELEAARLQLQAMIESGGIDVTSDTGSSRKKRPRSTTEANESTASISESDSPPEVQPIHRQVEVETTAGEGGDARRVKVDVAGMDRLVFGSLGVKTPKTQADRDSVQKKLARRAINNAAAPTTLHALSQAVESNAQVDHDEDDESWRSKLRITAIECWDEGVTLSAPPFPFQQYWDPQYNIQFKKRRKKQLTQPDNSRKKQRYDAYYVETYDKYNANGDDSLCYDEGSVFDSQDDRDWDDSALLANDEYDDAELDGQQEEISELDAVNFPQLPEDIDALPALLTASDAKAGDFITWKQLECSAATNWQPQMVDHIALLSRRNENEDAWTATLAPLEQPSKKFDEDGKRIYSKFEMQGLSDDEDADPSGDEIVNWGTMINVRLLRRGEEAES